MHWSGKLGQLFLSGKMINHQKAEIIKERRKIPQGPVCGHSISVRKKVAEWAD